VVSNADGEAMAGLCMLKLRFTASHAGWPISDDNNDRFKSSGAE
jgi:hypothetical protein